MTNRMFRPSARRACLASLVLGLVAGPALADQWAPTVFTESNASAGNQLLAFSLRSDGSLGLTASVPAHGLGSGGGLSNQGAVALAAGGSMVFAVNAASNSIAGFRIGEEGIGFVSITDSGGNTPVSLAVHGDLLYVLNQGSDSITGFRISRDGSLTAVADSTQALSGAGVVGTEVSFSAGGDYLIVTEKLGGRIDVYAVEEGIAQAGRSEISYGSVPFGFAVDRRDRLVVSEAGGSAVTSYDLDTDNGVLSVITGSLPTNQAAACWVAETPSGRFAYSGNAGSGSVSAFAIDHAGRLASLGATQIAPSAHTTDLAVSADGRYLFALSDGIQQIAALRIGSDGQLHRLPAMAALNLLSSATGLAVR